MFLKREDNIANNDPIHYGDYDYYSQTGYIVKYAIITAVSLLIFLWIVGGYIHAQRRMSRGLRPLAYHRWLVSRAQRTKFEHPQNTYIYYPNGTYMPPPYGNGHGMQAYPEPPPVYTHDAPPAYQPPAGASKASPEQNYGTPGTDSTTGPSQAAPAPSPNDPFPDVLPPKPARTTKSKVFWWLRRN